MRTASLRYGKSNALTMKPARSPHVTGCLPSLCDTARIVATTSSAVRTVGTTSTSFITGAGLKKCMPMTSVGRLVAVAHSMTGRLLVVDARIAPGLTTSSSAANSACFTGRSSTTASITKSQPASWPRSGVQVVARLVVYRVENFVRRVQADEVEQGERPHGVTATEAHCTVDVLAARVTAFVQGDRVVEVSEQQRVGDEPGPVPRSHVGLGD